MSLGNRIATLLIRLYQVTLVVFFGGRCRFQPSCSNYGLECFQKHTFFRALWLTSSRIIKCHPLGPYGYDPVPERKNL